MTARLVLPGTAARDEWLAARRSGVTASEIATILGLNPWDSPYALYWRKRGDLPEQDDSEAMALGRYLEAYVADRFAERHPEFLLDAQAAWTLYAHEDRPWQMCSPDRTVHDQMAGGILVKYHIDPIAVLECKTAASYDGWGDDGSDEIPVHYRCQVLWQMDVMGVQTGYVACLFLHSRKLRVYELTMDLAAVTDLKLMREEAARFLDRISAGWAPEPDWRPATTQALKRLHPGLEEREQVIPKRIAHAWLAACGRVKSAEHARNRLGNQILERLGNARYAVTSDGAKVATRSISSPKRVDVSQLRAEYPDAAAACTRPPEHPVIKLIPASQE